MIWYFLQDLRGDYRFSFDFLRSSLARSWASTKRWNNEPIGAIRTETNTRSETEFTERTDRYEQHDLRHLTERNDRHACCFWLWTS